ncbi:type II toxin-antitoxin system YafO family toxin [Providencia stuartii]|uniref:type II toxin-antitoxin system YafO family toxin n=1 Tax=Providencia stuartii TaxID=588 RepID=UPI00111FAF5A|nr:type II toxin-antitoxin system YafO family toxin [Providencia stuartii]
MPQEEKVTTDTNSKKPNRYCGKVFAHPSFADLCAKFPEIKIIYDYFIEYWRNGPHPSLGKDSLFNRPSTARESHVRHSHVNVGKYEAEGSENYRGTEEHWNKWLDILAANDSGEWKNKHSYFKAPTSDAFLVYSVNERRDAIVLDFIPDGSHRITERPSLMEFYTQAVFTHTTSKGMKPFPIDDHPFDEKYLTVNQISPD